MRQTRVRADVKCFCCIKFKPYRSSVKWVGILYGNMWHVYFIYFICLIYQGGMLAFNNRCSSLCCCLYSTSSFRLEHTEQRADSIYWIHKNNKPIKNGGMNNGITSPEETISLILLHNQWNSKKTAPCFLCSRDWSLRHSLVGIPNLEAHTAGNIWGSPVISSQGSREAIKSNSLQLKLCRVD